MTLLHVKLQGPSTTIDLPSSVKNPKIVLKAYRILFNKNDHGYYFGTVKCTLLNDGNVMSFTKRGDAKTYTNDIPLILDPEQKHTFVENVDIDMGTARSVSNIKFDIALFNCIERKRFDLAIFDSTDSEIQGLLNASSLQKYFGNKIPMYPVPTANMNDQVSNSPANSDFLSHLWFAADGKSLGSVPIEQTPIFPDSSKWVHTGVQVGNVDPQPGGRDYDERTLNVGEELIRANSGNILTGSGFRKNAIIYAYSVDLIFEIS
jgi:hypothetical protein